MLVAAMLLSGLIDLPPVTQSSESNCGPACLTAVFRYYGQWCFEQPLAAELGTTQDGTDTKDMARVARAHGFQAVSRTGGSLNGLRRNVGAGRPGTYELKV